MLTFSFVPINEIQVDLVQLIYDIFLAVITGYIVWFKTDEYMQRRDEAARYTSEQQEYSRYLSRVCNAIDSFLAMGNANVFELQAVIDDAPIRVVFHFQTDEQREVFEAIGDNLTVVSELIHAKSPDQEKLRKPRSMLFKYRRDILHFRLKQPRVNPIQFWGKPATARAASERR